ncbi:hypothetical protein JB92DRAFT_780955 [Gautieria morchelliformis]|nr:hypothetical protein JB92DRAFT_780955 [Gautieria morchelliformis]
MLLDQAEFLRGHPIFARNPLETPSDLSLNNLSSFKESRSLSTNLKHSSRNGVGRRTIMALRESDLLLAVGSEIRITSLSDPRGLNQQQRSYKTLYTPNVEFEIRQLTVNHNGKLLAVAGSHQVAVVSLPRAGYSKLVTSQVDCRTIQVGQFHHATSSAAPVAKVEWHPWGKSACTLLVMTVDGTFREYDMSMDPEEPQQTLSFMPERSRASSFRGDSSSRDVVSFCLGNGKADWGPLTVYALTKSGDIWAMCPFMPSNAMVPSAYIHALEYFVRAKEESAAYPQAHSELDASSSRNGPSLSTLYAYQLKYVVSLSKQLPETPSTLFPSPSRSVPVTAPSIVKPRPVRQGPFLFQPAPRELDQGQGGSATDMVYITVEGTSLLHPDEDGSGERLGIFAVAFSDGKIDICLDVEKIEAMWETSRFSSADTPTNELPMVAVYETIDLGLVSMLSRLPSTQPASWLGKQQTTSRDHLELLQANHPVFVSDPIYQDTIYLYHAFGVHCLNMSCWLQPLARSLRNDVSLQVERLVNGGIGTEVTCLLDTFSQESKSSQPVASVVLPNDVYLSYSLFAIMNSLDIHILELDLRVEAESPTDNHPQPLPDVSSLPPSVLLSVPGVEAQNPSLVSLLSKESYDFPRAISMAAIDDVRKLGLPTSAKTRQEIEITPELLRQFVTTVHRFQGHIRDIHMALHGLQNRLMLQDKEFQRQQEKYVEIVKRTERLKSSENDRIKQRFEQTTSQQKRLLGRCDKLLQAFMDTSSPVLNEHEKRWFAELRRMKADVLGEGNYDSASLKARTETLSNKLEYYLPSLQELAKLEEQRREEAARNPVVLGRAQELRIMLRLGEHKKMLSDAVQSVEQLAQRMNVDLECVPNLGL